MTKRIIGQCNTADFRYLEHLTDVMVRGEEVDLTNLTRKQKSAVMVLRLFQEKGVHFKVLLKIKEVIIWDTNTGTIFEYRLINPHDAETRKILINSGAYTRKRY